MSTGTRRIAVTGPGGRIGHGLCAGLTARGWTVIPLARRPDRFGPTTRPFDLGHETPPDLSSCDALVHLALDHLPGRYRGGEGDDPAGFLRRNRDGTARLFAAAEAAGVARVIFLSSRAVYGPQPRGARLTEATPCVPDTLYGQVKLAGEALLRGRAFDGVALRATGIYGPPPPGQLFKWADLIAAYAHGVPVAPRQGTELHLDDLTAAVDLLLRRAPADLPPCLNISDLLLDRRDLLALWTRLTGQTGPLPPRCDPKDFNVMNTDRARALGWRPQGQAGLEAALRDHADTLGIRPLRGPCPID
ncbi:NAD-dependent epimerase/dehydratase family protein [Oceanomicrobium pacificus]|uniref:NAD-dependent epimerase/dehydratase family protein n=1 Tax=Oceanomicrobium pacificus TaxID=2692916 RepID=A0A6B0TRU0_9RHOB|nr:NAD(P)-dependent oxidoreductase [Oceanomicrobium pacificus]MXU63922.1 NAD-dependent epimerase/dehydratase family protein [Oceanomicrobium pacificus]